MLIRTLHTEKGMDVLCACLFVFVLIAEWGERVMAVRVVVVVVVDVWWVCGEAVQVGMIIMMVVVVMVGNGDFSGDGGVMGVREGEGRGGERRG